MKGSTNMKWEGRWDQLAGKVKKIWGAVTDNDLQEARGDYQRTVGVIKEKTGLAAEEIERRINEGL